MNTNSKSVTTEATLVQGYPSSIPVSASNVRAARSSTTRRLIVLDDDPTGTQSVKDLPVLTEWGTEDLSWALATAAPAVYILTNSRSLSATAAAERNREVAENSLAAADALGIEVDFVSRSDSTLRGHFPLEPEILTEVLEKKTDAKVDGILFVPAFAEAGRITVGSVHYARSGVDGFLPVGETEFARDASFSFSSSNLRDWVEEKSNGRHRADDVYAVTLDILRQGAESVTEALMEAADAAPIVADCVEESDLRVLALGILGANAAGKRFIYRVGPPFVRALIGQELAHPLTDADVATIREGGDTEEATGGLVVVGSHVGVTTRQLEVLRTRGQIAEIEIDVAAILGDRRQFHLREVIANAIDTVASKDLVIRTSRRLITGRNADDSLDISRTVSAAVVEVVQRILEESPPRFVVAKGGITSSDVARYGLSITRAMVRGPMLPGIVSLWEPMDGPAQGIPYIVFAGNVGNDESLADVVDILRA